VTTGTTSTQETFTQFTFSAEFSLTVFSQVELSQDDITLI
jgi:hypothetical protein